MFYTTSHADDFRNENIQFTVESNETSAKLPNHTHILKLLYELLQWQSRAVLSGILTLVSLFPYVN